MRQRELDFQEHEIILSVLHLATEHQRYMNIRMTELQE